ncbi:unnamed protein product, partial [Ixodes hexagonus]
SGTSDESTPSSEERQKGLHCFSPMDEGRCQKTDKKDSHREPVLQYYFDSQTHCCKPFVYMGCGGNGNRFQNETECSTTCKRRRSDGSTDPPNYVDESMEADIEVFRVRCLQERDLGKCCRHANKRSWRYYYDSYRQICRLFRFAGCGGNANNYRSWEECTQACNQRGKGEPEQESNTECTGDVEPQSQSTSDPISGNGEKIGGTQPNLKCALTQNTLYTTQHSTTDTTGDPSDESQSPNSAQQSGNYGVFNQKTSNPELFCSEPTTQNSIGGVKEGSGISSSENPDGHDSTGKEPSEGPSASPEEETHEGGTTELVNGTAVMVCRTGLQLVCADSQDQTKENEDATSSDNQKGEGPGDDNVKTQNQPSDSEPTRRTTQSPSSSPPNAQMPEDSEGQKCGIDREEGFILHSIKYVFMLTLAYLYTGYQSTTNPSVSAESNSSEPGEIDSAPRTTTTNRTHLSKEGFVKFCREMPEDGVYCELDGHYGYYYDGEYEPRECRRYYFLGCESGNNHFETLRECNQYCNNHPYSKYSSFFQLPWTRESMCLAPPDTGMSCTKAQGTPTLDYFYYNSSAGACRSMKYLGCGGNRNKYRTLKECAQACKDVKYSDYTDRYNEVKTSV